MTNNERGEFDRAFGNLESKVDAILSNQEDFKRALERQETASKAGHDKLDGRVTAVEAKINRWGGAIGVLFAVYVFVGDKLRSALFGS